MTVPVALLVVLATPALADDCVGHLHDFPGYDPTACFPLDRIAELPKECLAPTWSLDPPCPRCWNNSAPEYVPGVSPIVVTPELKASLSTRLPKYLDHMQSQRPATHSDTGTVFTGIGGRALLYLKLHEATGDSGYLAQAAPYVEAMTSKLPSQKVTDKALGYSGFQWSHIGMSCVAALYADRGGEAPSLIAKYVAEVHDAFAGHDSKYDDFDSGSAGLLYASRFLDANVKPLGQPKIERFLVAALATRIVDRGASTAAANGHPGVLQWHGPNDAGLWLGQSHGVSGVIQQLLEVPELLQNATAVGYIKRTLDWVVSQQFASGNFPTEYYNATQDWLVQWDHGAPGVSAALLAAWKVFGDESYRAAAVKALDCVWVRGLLLKGLMNCHGIGGNIWMQLYASKVLGDPMYTYRALAFLKTVLDTPLLSDLDQMRQPQPLPDTPWQFWTGSIESSIELWTDILYRGAANASETGFEAAL